MTGITLRAVYIIKLGGDEGSGTGLSGVYFEGERDGNLEDGNEHIDESSLWY